MEKDDRAATVAAIILVVATIVGSLAFTGACIWALVEVVSWLVTK